MVGHETLNLVILVRIQVSEREKPAFGRVFVLRRANVLFYYHMPKIAVVIPTYNEKENIAELIGRIYGANPDSLAVIFVDDNSPDGTAEEIYKYAGLYPIKLIGRKGKLGLGSAYIAGFNKALSEGAEIIVEMDADLSHAPEDISKLIKATKDGAGLALGSRKIPGGKIVGWNLWRHLMSNGAMLTARLFLGLKTRDITSGFRAYRRQVLENIDLKSIKSNGYAFQEEMLYRTEKLGYKIVEIPVTFADRSRGRSKLSFRDILEFFKVMIKLR